MVDELTIGHHDLRLLHRHYINLTCLDSGAAAMVENCGKPKRYNFCAFIVNVEEVMLAITAGHVFADLKRAVDAGASRLQWIVSNPPFDRLYFYGADRPLHVSYSASPPAQVTVMRRTAQGNLVPKTLDSAQFLNLK